MRCAWTSCRYGGAEIGTKSAESSFGVTAGTLMCFGWLSLLQYELFVRTLEHGMFAVHEPIGRLVAFVGVPWDDT
jgi:hypothetical protein